MFDRILARVGPDGVLPPWAQRTIGPLTGFSQVLTTTTTAKAFLEFPDVTVPYGERSRLLGIGAFPLGLDGTAHKAARVDQVEPALLTSRRLHLAGVAAARATVERRVAGATDRIDLIHDLVDPALHAWIETWYGLDTWGLRLARAGHLLQHATFLNPTTPGGHTDVTALRFAVGTLEATASELTARLSDRPPPAGTVAAALLASTKDREVTVSHLLGLTVGPLVLGSQTIATVLDDLLYRSWELDGLAPRPGETLKAAEHRARATFAAVLARKPPLPGVLRHNPTKRSVPGGSGLVKVPEGEILVATGCAMALSGGTDDSLAFGWGNHACLGRTQITEVAGAVLVAAAARSPRRRRGTQGRLRNALGPTAIPDWPFLGHLDVDLTA